jgi:hypothetical protein
VAPAVDATLSQKLAVWWLRHNKERVFGTAHDLLKEMGIPGHRDHHSDDHDQLIGIIPERVIAIIPES